VIVERGLAARAGLLLKETVPDTVGVAVITTEAVRKEHERLFVSALGSSGFAVTELAVPGGERPKDLDDARNLYVRLGENVTAKPLAVAAWGGASLCHLAGFVAATYEYGLPWVVFPTSLSGMLDPGLYARVGVEFRGTRNVVGATWPPILIAADPGVLAGLPPQYLGEALARAVGTAAVAGEEMFELLERQGPSVVRGGEAIDEIVFNYLEIHAGHKGLRPPGSCLAPVFAAIKRYGFTPGEAAAIGLVYEGLIAEITGNVSTDFTVRVADLLRLFGLPIYLPSLRPEELASAFEIVHPTRDGRIALNVPHGFGDVREEYISVKAILQLLPQVHKLARSR
jgi:3-dehydroquinate synthetase